LFCFCFFFFWALDLFFFVLFCSTKRTSELLWWFASERCEMEWLCN
jgi:hypothetical protein